MYTTVDYHTAGEPFRIVTGGAPDIPGRSVLERRDAAIAGEADRMQTDITEVASVAEASSASAEQVSASTQQTSASTQEIASSAHELAGTAEHLATLVGRFKTTA